MQHITRFVSIYFISAILSLSIMTIYLILSKTITGYMHVYMCLPRSFKKTYLSISPNIVTTQYMRCVSVSVCLNISNINNYCLLSKNLIKVIILDLVWHGQVPGKIYKYNCDQYNSLLLVF